ncbi:MAG TPA: hypothetical protein VLX11_07780 [Candidatus Acidoferrales bacterium]|nr:hypothetical protein [Candidatus Acidoferrales bacterium]
MSIGRVVWRHRARSTDWALIVAFVRLDFPPDQRDAAQKIAIGLAQIVGIKIKRLRPEHTLKQIARWAEGISAGDLVKIFLAGFGIVCDENTTFRMLVEKVAARNVDAGQRAAPLRVE